MAYSTLPKVGQHVKVELINRSNVLKELFPDIPDTVTYEGTVVSGAPWDNPNTFRISGNTEMPVRVLHLKNVIKIDGKPTHFKERPAIISKTFTVLGSTGTVYEVVFDQYGNGHCPCKGYGYRKHCSHIEEAYKQYLNPH